ncbi:hypothetical protein DKM44_01810 [Deinococcus irradiatisoli]|uniref:Uncharacterized protein n=1 Tax=Deinococcus irradiatisoli TaxID=2202254 RepID=A0A2Z3JGR7_9DEIO|nr:hypothetical protein [Deinococcus irradiatisoli]AWN22129.1 hypothetical protein DKM44_01810 [Deinococcus irradiatisoli]
MTDEQHGELAQLMMDLFPAGTERYLRLYPTPPEQLKDMREIKRRARVEDYERHLDVRSFAGPGGLGLIPGIQSGTTWRTPWAVMDFDASTPPALANFFSVLIEHSLQFTFSYGTTGRGAHVWFFLDQAVTLKQAHRALAFLRQVAELQGYERPEVRPSGLSESGMGILLPYRGAADDGLGANPLWSPIDGVQIGLRELAEVPKQKASSFVKLGALKSPQRFAAGLVPKERPRLTSRMPSVLDDPTFRWQAELTRLKALWKQGRRHHLTVAVTAYGVSLGLDHDTIRNDVMDLIQHTQDEEVQGREKVIERGLGRSAEGKALNDAEFYGFAGVDTARTAELTEARLRLEVGLDILMTQPWPGKSGKTDRSLYKTLLLAAWEYGYPHPSGVELSMAWSELGDSANIASTDTLNKSLVRLEKAGLVSRGRYSVEGNSGTFVLLVTKRSILLRGPDAGESFGLSPALRNGGGALGKTREQILDLLVWHGPQSREELASSMATRWQDLKMPLSSLLYTGLIHEVGTGRTGFLSVAENWRSLLDERQRSDGSEWRQEGQRALAQKKTAGFRKRLIALQLAKSQPTAATDSSLTESPSSSDT